LKYSPQSMFLNGRQNYTLVHSNLHTFRQWMRGQTFLDSMVASITRLQFLPESNFDLLLSSCHDFALHSGDKTTYTWFSPRLQLTE
jgi:hypothetical protein